MKKWNGVFFLFVFLPFFFISCTLESPDFIVEGVQVEEAILFLKKFQKGKKDKEQFEHYMHYLRTKHAPGFAWEQYWFEIKENKLYKNLESSQLSQMLSLSEVSCQYSNDTSFSNLLLEIARTDSKKLLFSQQLARLRKTCFTGLSHFAFKSIVRFLSDKRLKVEIENIQKSRKQLEAQRYKKIGPIKKKYIYTEELQKVLIDEWSKNRSTRVWDDILSLVDRAFWSDARWINYQNRDKRYLKKTMEMEWVKYQSVAGLDRDIFLIFEEGNKMADALDFFGYKHYFAISGIIDWSFLWKSFLSKYPEKPENKNVDSLLSMYSFSCQEEDLTSYSRLVEQWSKLDYKRSAIEFCVKTIVTNAKNTLPETELEKGKIDSGPLGKREGLSSSPLMYDVVETSLKNNPGPKSLQSLDALLSVYEKDKYVRTSDEWKKLINYFSEEDWLSLMRILRDRYDRKTIVNTLDMHNQVYKGRISFLVKDILAVFISEGKSVSDMTDKYGYNITYLNNPYFLSLFWKELENTIDHTSAVDLKIQEKAKQCDYSYVSGLFRFFSRHGRKELLFDGFNFGNCLHFIDEFRQKEWIKLVRLTEEMDIVDGRVRFVKNSNVNDSSEEEMSVHFVWWLARVLSFYSFSSDSDNYLLREVVSKINVFKWTTIIQVMLQSLKDSDFKGDVDLFNSTVYTVNTVYVGVANRSVCYFFNEKDSHLLISKYDPQFIVDLLYSLDWYRFQKNNAIKLRRRRANIRTGACNNIVPDRKLNTLLFVLTYSALELVESASKKISKEEYISQIWHHIYRMINLFEHMGLFYQVGIKDYIERWFKYYMVVDYESEKGHMSDQSFYFYFSALVLGKFRTLIHTKEDMNHLLESFFNEHPPVNAFDQNQRKRMKELVKDIEKDKPVKWEDELNMLKEKLHL